MRKNPDLTSITQNKIKNAFWELYKVKPIERITVKEICDKSNYNRSTFYAHFKDIYDVLDNIENDIIIILKELAENNPNFFFTTKDFVYNLVEIYNTNGEYLYYLLNNNSSFIAKYKNVLKSVFLLKDFNDCAEKNFKYELLFEYIVSSVISSLSYWYPRREQISTEEFIEYIHSIAKNGPISQLKELLDK